MTNQTYGHNGGQGCPTSIATDLEPHPEDNGGVPVWPLVIEDVRLNFSDSEGIVADMEARDAWGRAKYGTPLQSNNGRDALVDAYQEALDLAVYLKQSEIEGGEVWRKHYGPVLRIAVDLRRAIVERDSTSIVCAAIAAGAEGST